MLLKDIRDRIDTIPGITQKERAVRCYAKELFADLMENKRLIIFDDIKDLGNVTENHLLNGYWDWETYSKNANSLIYTDDITMRLFGKKRLSQEELRVLTGGRELLLLQADVLREAASFILDTIKEMENEADKRTS